jgi:hypothetical protein
MKRLILVLALVLASKTAWAAANGYPQTAFPQHLSGQTNTVRSYVWIGGVRPTPGSNGYPNGAFPQHLSGQTTTVQDYIPLGAVWGISSAAAVVSPQLMMMGVGQ